MGAREELAAIRERAATARVRATEDEADLARRPTRLMSQSQHDRRLLARDNVRLVKALEAVVETADEWAASPAVGASSEEQWELDTLRNAARSLHEDLAALTTDTKGEPR